MFSQVSPAEIVLVLAIALIVLGPKRLPSAARSAGRSLREFKQSLSEIDPRDHDDDQVDAPAPEPARTKTPAAD